MESWEAWKAWRIGAVSEAARSRVSRNVIMRSGGWRSSAVDTYWRVEDAGVRVGTHGYRVAQSLD